MNTVTIYKYATHKDWDAIGVAKSSYSGGSSGGAFIFNTNDYYTKADLQTEGLASVHFDNISDAYHNNLLDIQGGIDTSSGDDSGYEAEYYHLDATTYYDIVNISFVDSIVKDSINAVSLVNDEDTPGNSKYYGTDGSGTKGYHDLTTSAQPFQTVSFANPLEIDCTTYKDWICTLTGDCTVNINNLSDGDAGMLELIINGSSSGDSLTVTFGTMWTKKMGPTDFDGSDGADNIVSWRAIGDGSTQEIVYTIGIIEV
jgi:hypothetical protein